MVTPGHSLWERTRRDPDDERSCALIKVNPVGYRGGQSAYLTFPRQVGAEKHGRSDGRLSAEPFGFFGSREGDERRQTRRRALRRGLPRRHPNVVPNLHEGIPLTTGRYPTHDPSVALSCLDSPQRGNEDHVKPAPISGLRRMALPVWSKDVRWMIHDYMRVDDCPRP